jgi:hypothetical protein
MPSAATELAPIHSPPLGLVLGRLGRLVMGDIVKGIQVQDWLAKVNPGETFRHRMYRVRITFDTEAMASPEVGLRYVFF